MAQSPPTSTKRKILNTALQMLQSQSYHSFSLKDLADNVLIKDVNGDEQPIKKASLYYHFSSKEDLVIATIKHYHEKIIYLTTKLNNLTEDTWERLDNYFKFFEHFIEQGFLCPATVLGSELNTVPKEVNIELNSLFDYYIDWLTKLLESGQERGEIVLENSPRDTAILFESAISGATILARSHNKKKYFQTIRDVLMRSVSPNGTIHESEDLLKLIQV